MYCKPIHCIAPSAYYRCLFLNATKHYNLHGKVCEIFDFGYLLAVNIYNIIFLEYDKLVSFGNN